MLELAHIVWTISLLVIFIAIIVWAWSKPQRQRFERAAQAPLLDDGVPQKNENALGATTEGNGPLPLTLDPSPQRGEGNKSALRATSQGNAPLPLTLGPSPQRGEGNKSALRATVNKVRGHG